MQHSATPLLHPQRAARAGQTMGGQHRQAIRQARRSGATAWREIEVRKGGGKASKRTIRARWYCTRIETKLTPQA